MPSIHLLLMDDVAELESEYAFDIISPSPQGLGLLCSFSVPRLYPSSRAYPSLMACHSFSRAWSMFILHPRSAKHGDRKTNYLVFEREIRTTSPHSPPAARQVVLCFSNLIQSIADMPLVRHENFAREWSDWSGVLSVDMPQCQR
jgi:hypothetical protein